MTNENEKKKIEKKYWIIGSAILALAILTTGIVLAVNAKKPKLDDIYDRVVELTEASVPLNTVYYGTGLPVYRQDSEYVNLVNLYFGFDYGEDYEIVSPYSSFSSIEDIKAATEAVYSRDFREKSLYASAFDGIAFSDVTGKSYVSAARYLDSPFNGLLQSTDEENVMFQGVRIYDYSTMKILKPTTSESVYVQINSYTESDPTVVPVKLHLVLEDGKWMLDSFAG